MLNVSFTCFFACKLSLTCGNVIFAAVCVFQDKTFGLKNKKGAKQQKFIKNVTQQVKYGQQSARQVEDCSLFFCKIFCLLILVSQRW